MVDKHDMVIIGNARYRYDDAKRLGMIADGKAITARSAFRPPSVTTAVGAEVPAANDGQPDNTVDETPQDDAQGADKSQPSRSAKKAEWTAYALDNGLTEDDLKGLTRDQISELFPDDPEDDE